MTPPSFPLARCRIFSELWLLVWGECIGAADHFGPRDALACASQALHFLWRQLLWRQLRLRGRRCVFYLLAVWCRNRLCRHGAGGMFTLATVLVYPGNCSYCVEGTACLGLNWQWWVALVCTTRPAFFASRCWHNGVIELQHCYMQSSYAQDCHMEPCHAHTLLMILN